ncbi:MAG TPA: M20 family metallo-hydrolase [Solirubrobacter sp.]|nr:M20 family metallo-hydrolase [Solirubrobacter sp.]
MSTVEVSAQAVDECINALARFGAYGDTGVWRTVYSPEWQAAQHELARWCREAGMDVRWDAVGNLWARLEGTEGGDSIVTGSHIDTQIPGGRFDGTLGVVGGFLALRELKRRFGPPRRTLELLSICEEESSRFPKSSFWGSRAITGDIAVEEFESQRDGDGVSIGEAMRSVGCDPGALASARRADIDVFLELHIEQGPVLEQAGVAVGVVTGVSGLHRYAVEVLGRSDHAGARPMDSRLDAMIGAAAIVLRVCETASAMGRPAVTTVGKLVVEPNYPSAVAEKVSFTIDVRHPDAEVLAELCRRHEVAVQEETSRRGLGVHVTKLLEVPPAPCDPALVELLTDVAAEQSVTAPLVASGAGHNLQELGKVARTGMVFVRTAERGDGPPVTAPDAAEGAGLLAAAMRRLAY